jgi:hypothetical protein
MTDELIGILHIISSFILSLYFLWRTTTFDHIYIMYLLLLNLSWILFKDECFVSYIFKKGKDNNYELGDSPQDIKDYETILGKEKTYIFVYFLRIMTILNVSYIIYLGSFNITYSVLVFLFVLSYIFYISIFDKKHTYSEKQNKFIRKYHTLITSLTLIYSILMYSGLIKKDLRLSNR